MGWRAWLKCLVGVALALSVVIEVRAKQPVFVSWLVADDPGDQTILHYWERYELEELSPTEMVDLGTMLFYRGYPKDAVRVLETALDQDKELYEAWFRIGLVEHQQGNLRDARIAYKRCLKILKGHGWCNFYLGLLEEQEGHGKTAMGYFRAAFRYAPKLADREVNPEIASSDLSLGAWLMMAQDNAFKSSLPMSFLHPKRVSNVKAKFSGEVQKPKGKSETKAQVQEVEPATGKIEKIEQPPATSGAKGRGTAKIVPMKKSAETSKAKSPKGSTTPTSKKPRDTTPYTAPTPAPPGASETKAPFGLPGNRGVSSDAYPGF